MHRSTFAQKYITATVAPLLGAALAAAVALTGCLDLGDVEKPKITSNVTDWRDEVIYQLIVDRYANGDRNNDGPRIEPNALARYQGGDWQGVIDHMDYLEALGVTTIWISPVVRNVATDADVDGYHGYWTQDFERTNPYMGDLAKLRELVNKAHARGIKVVLDIVTNHVGQLFFYDINNNGTPQAQLDEGSNKQSPLTHVTEFDPDFDPRGIQGYTSLGESGPAPIRWLYMPEIHRMPPEPAEFQNPNWYNRRGRVTCYEKKEYPNTPWFNCTEELGRMQTLTGDFPGGLKDLKTVLPEVQEALTRVFNQWIDAADFDGFRIDTLKHVEYEFWDYFCPGVRQHAKDIGKKNFFMFGEAFDGRDDLVGSYTKGQGVDSAFFFPQKFSVFDRVIKYNNEGTSTIENQFKARADKYHNLDKGDPVKQNGVVDAEGKPLSAQDLMVNFIDNHDIARFLYDKNSVPALHNALGFLLTEDGIPCIYYGTEQQFRGGNDPQNRERLWDTGFRTDGETFQWIRRLIDVRKKYRPLRRGKLAIKWASNRNNGESDSGIFAFERVTQDNKRVLVVINVTDEKRGNPTSITQAPNDQGGGKMKVDFPPGTTLVSEVGPPDVVTVGGDGTVAITVPRRERRGDGTVEGGIRVFVPMTELGGIP